jgi:hypothetical protein
MYWVPMLDDPAPQVRFAAAGCLLRHGLTRLKTVLEELARTCGNGPKVVGGITENCCDRAAAFTRR